MGTVFRTVKEINNLCENYEFHLQINSVEPSPSCEAASRSTTQQISKMLWSPKFITVFTKALH
jgi:hypothetical protein